MNSWERKRKEWRQRILEDARQCGDKRPNHVILAEASDRSAFKMERAQIYREAFRDQENVRSEVVIPKGHYYPQHDVGEGEVLSLNVSYVNPVMVRR